MQLAIRIITCFRPGQSAFIVNIPQAFHRSGTFPPLCQPVRNRVRSAQVFSGKKRR